MFNIPQKSEILLDFDGTIADSNFIKENAIAQAVAVFSANEAFNTDFVKYFVKHNGITREKKISLFFPDADVADKICRLYGEILQDKLLDCPLTDGCRLCLQRLYDKGCSLSVISGGMADEIEKILQNREIAHFFQNIYAAPLEKKEHLSKLLLPESAFLIGDSKVDYEAATSADIDFIFVYGYTQFVGWQDFFANKNVSTIRNLKELG